MASQTKELTWLEKYKPTKSSDIIGDRAQFDVISDFIKQFNTTNREDILCPTLIITGPNGIGKTLLVDLLLKENNIEKVIPDLSNVSVARKSKKNAPANPEGESAGVATNKTNKSVNTYYVSLTNRHRFGNDGILTDQKFALVFNGVGNMTNSKEKEAIKAILKLNKKYAYFPIIIIASIKHNKIVNKLKKIATYSVSFETEEGKKQNKKMTNEIQLNYPTFAAMEKFIKFIATKEQLKLISGEDDIYEEIIKHSQGDIRRLINILEELKTFFNDETGKNPEPITVEKFQRFCETSKRKDIDPGIYEATRILLNEFDDIDKTIILYSKERATIPLMIQENYPSNIKTQYNKLSIDDQIDMMYDISKAISESDKIDGLIYSSQCWNLQSVHGFYSCTLPSYHINKFPDKKCNIERYVYTQDFNKTSIKKINNKVIKGAQKNKYLKRAQIHDFLYIASILNTLLIEKKFVDLAKIMNFYGLNLKEILSLIKINKIEVKDLASDETTAKNTAADKKKCTLTAADKNILGDLLVGKAKDELKKMNTKKLKEMIDKPIADDSDIDSSGEE